MENLTAVMAQCRDVVVDAPLHVFWAQSGDETSADRDDWLASTGAAGASTVTSIPGDHVSILDAPHSGTIADVIGQQSGAIPQSAQNSR
jgi:thioesterase domain-containing protein